MWFIKHVTILIYAASLYVISFYITILRISDWFLNKDIIFNKSYDYIIVGSGSAGSVVALRLSENKNITVLVVEAGSYGGKLLDVPMGGPALQGTAADWQYKTIPQDYSCFGLNNNQSVWPMGKIIGGSMYLNNLVYIRGHPSDYENWFGDEFNYSEDVLNYFKKSENQCGSYKNDLKNHATKGPLVVNDIPFISQFGKAVINAAEELDFPIVDLNSNVNTGFMTTQVNVNFGERYTTSHYLLAQKRINVQFLTQTLVHKVLFHSNFEATGIEFSLNNKIHKMKAKKGVILSAGAIGTPKILLQSGVGPKDDLQELGIDTILNLPVGRNLQDHVTTGLDLILLNKSIDMSMERCISPFSLIDYVFYGRGPLSSPGCEAVGLIDFDGDTVPDLQLMVIPMGIAKDGGIHFRKAMGISDKSYKYFSKLLYKNSVSVLPILLHPKSKGYVKLLDKNPNSQPIINPNYLKNDYDVNVLLKGIDLIKKLLQTKTMVEFEAMLNTNKFPGCEKYNFDTREYWECYIRHLTLTSYHPVGTCKLGHENDKSRVVEKNFKVRGSNKLFVADASTLPSLPSGNINAAVIMMAEKAAEAIKEDYYLSSSAFCYITDILLKTKDFVSIQEH